MRRRAALIVALIAGMVGVSAGVASAAPEPTYAFLHPGGPPTLTERLPVNVVFLGYQPNQVRKPAFLSGLSKTYEPVVRSRLNYGQTRKVGITYTYDYRVSYANKSYQDKFFTQLGRLAKRAPLTEYQKKYNAQRKNVKNVTANALIDAPTVEKWLAYHPPAGVDTRRNTIFFINWYGRADFKFHVYTKTDEPDPDTGYNFGRKRDSRKIIAWGGSTADDKQTGLGSARRVWFHDLSAGPESWTSNFDVDHPDLNDDGEADYRMPPVWEYTARGFRAPAALTRDLSLITRYVALNLLMTTSPLYPVELPTPGPPKSINVDSNTYQGWPGVNAATRYIKPTAVVQKLSALRWRNRVDFDNQNLPYDAKAKQCYEGMFVTATSCYPESGLPPFANLYLYNWANLKRTQDDVGRVDYELPIFNYALGPGVDSRVLGMALDNFADGTQGGVFTFLSPESVADGYGLTTTQIHEAGHHLGMSHPHDGYDSQSRKDYQPDGRFYFANAGGEVNSVMSYIDLNWDFSQFDRDNSDRFLTAAYHEAANKLAAKVLVAATAGKARDRLSAADRLLGWATKAFARHDYRAAYAFAEGAYQQVVAAAQGCGVDPAAVAKELRAEADAARKAVDLHSPYEFIDTLAPDSPRSQP
jgi:hypothetical protein